MSRIGALALRDAVLDEGSFISWDGPPLDVAADADYRRELADAAAATGFDESVLTGEGRVFGRRIASPLPSSAPPRSVFRWSRRRVPVAPACRRARWRSSRW